MAGFTFSEWMLSGMVAAWTARSTENRRTKGFCYTTTVTLTPDTTAIAEHQAKPCLSTPVYVEVFFTRNVNALTRSSPDCALLTTLCSQLFTNLLNQKCPRTHKRNPSQNRVALQGPEICKRSRQTAG